jgi:hypothetical protein
VHDYLLKYAIGVCGILYNMLASLEDIQAILWHIVTLAIGYYLAITMKDIADSIVLCSDGECRLRRISDILKEYRCLRVAMRGAFVVILHK